MYLKNKYLNIYLHGVRSHGTWSDSIMEHFQANDYEEYVHYTARWGMLPATIAILPPVRSAKVRWFMKLYKKLRKKYPDLEINVIAHSMGTFILGEALVRAFKNNDHSLWFNRIITIGSILSEDFPWDPLWSFGSVDNVVNIYSKNDPVIMGDLIFGNSGINGFDCTDSRVLRNIRHDHGHNGIFKEEEFPEFIHKALTYNPRREQLAWPLQAKSG